MRIRHKNIISLSKRTLLVVLMGLLSHMLLAQVTVDARIDSLELFVGQQTQITLEVSCDKKSKLQLPQLKPGDMITPGVEIVNVYKPDTQDINEGVRHLINQRYTVTSFDSSLYFLPPFIVKVDNKEYKSKSLALQVLTIPVDTLHLDQYFGPKDIVDAPFSWEDWKLVFCCSLLLVVWVLALIYLYVRYRDNKPIIKIIKRAPKLPPHTQAMQEINRIKEDKMWAKEDSKEYYTMLTSTLRTYIQNRYGFNALEMTSTEIIDKLMSLQNDKALDELRSLFRTADLVKFAKYSTLINENDRNLVSAMEFINQTKVETEINTEEVIPDEVKVEQKRSRRTLWIFRISLFVSTIIALMAIVWIVWMVYNLLS